MDQTSGKFKDRPLQDLKHDLRAAFVRKVTDMKRLTAQQHADKSCSSDDTPGPAAKKSRNADRQLPAVQAPTPSSGVQQPAGSGDVEMLSLPSAEAAEATRKRARAHVDIAAMFQRSASAQPAEAIRKRGRTNDDTAAIFQRSLPASGASTDDDTLLTACNTWLHQQTPSAWKEEALEVLRTLADDSSQLAPLKTASQFLGLELPLRASKHVVREKCLQALSARFQLWRRGGIVGIFAAADHVTDHGGAQPPAAEPVVAPVVAVSAAKPRKHWWCKLIRTALEEIRATLKCPPERMQRETLFERDRELRSLLKFQFSGKHTCQKEFIGERKLLGIPARKFPFGKKAGQYFPSREFVHYELCKRALHVWRTESQQPAVAQALEQAPLTPRAFHAFCADASTRELSPFHPGMEQWSSLWPSTSQCIRQLALIELPGQCSPPPPTHTLIIQHIPSSHPF